MQLTGSVAIIYTLGALFGGIFFGTLSERMGASEPSSSPRSSPCPSFLCTRSPPPSFPSLSEPSSCSSWCREHGESLPAWLTELSPGPVRATFPGLAYQLGNLITSGNSVIQAKAAERFGGFGPVLAVTVLLVACFLAVVVAFGKESRGTELTV